MFKSYSEKSKAKRALSSIGTAALMAAEKLLRQGEDGRWGFEMDDAEAIQNAADEAKEDEGTARQSSATMKSMISQLSGETKPVPAAKGAVTKVRDGKKVSNSAPAPVVKAEPKPAPAAPVEAASKGVKEGDACPLCNADPSSQTWANEGVSCYCHECGKTYSIKTGREIRTGHTRPNASKGYTIQKNRPEQNGVKRPSDGTVCGRVWAEFDANPSIQAKELPALADKHGWNRNNVSCEFYAWRKFNGIKGRQ